MKVKQRGSPALRPSGHALTTGLHACLSSLLLFSRLPSLRSLFFSLLFTMLYHCLSIALPYFILCFTLRLSFSLYLYFLLSPLISPLILVVFCFIFLLRRCPIPVQREMHFNGGAGGLRRCSPQVACEGV